MRDAADGLMTTKGILAEFWAWMFRVPDGERSSWEVIKWWELRRLPYNLIVGAAGFMSMIIAFTCIPAASVLNPAEDAIERMLEAAISFLIRVFCFVNIFYCGGWFVENVVDDIWPSEWPSPGPLLLKLGLGFSVTIVAEPAVFWLGYRLLRVVGIIG